MVTKTDRGIIAAHYIYVLKDYEDLGRIWSALTRGTELSSAEPFSLALASGRRRHYARGCSIISRSAVKSREVCPGMLTELAAIEIKYARNPGKAMAAQWDEVTSLIEADRELAGIDEATTIGETTLLVSSEMTGEALSALAREVFRDSHLLISAVDPAVGGGENPLWAYVLSPERSDRDSFLLSAETPDTIVESLFPEADSILKKLDRTGKYFAHQRQTIIRERLQVDKEVAAILHERVVSSNDTYDPERLERDIENLSRMFGVLATDTQLVRQAAEQLEKDRNRLDHALSPIRTSGGSKDDAAEYFFTRHDSELANAQAESESLEFSGGTPRLLSR